MIGGSDIHSWLEGAIDSAQSREAAVVNSLLKEFNDLDLIFDTYRAQAEELAKKAKIRDDNDIFFKKN